MEQHEGQSPRRRSILVVDDTEKYRNALERLLRQAGYRVLTAEDGAEALRRVADEAPDLILLDVMMPGINGFETCSRLKAEAATEHIPVVFISGVDDVAAKARAFACGGVDYVTKPFLNDEVLMRVAAHLALNQMQRDLEERVRERTAELAVANRRLEGEIAERRQAEEKFRGVVESAPEAMVIVDDRRAMVIINSQAERLFGYRREQLLGRPIELLMPDSYQAGHASKADAYFEEPRQRSMGEGLALQGRHADGSEFPIEVALSPLSTPAGRLVISTIRDISERRQAEAALRDLAAHRDAVREEERKRIAGEIHDELGSLLTALKMDVSLLRMELPADAPALGRVEQMRELIERTIRMVREVATQLRPAALNLGLEPALEWLVEDFRRRTGIACSFAADAEVAMDDAQATAVFRIVQESLTNVARHAAAACVEVSLGQSAGRLQLTVADDGRGFDPATIGGMSFGMFGIRERVRALDGQISIVSRPGQGTRVAISIPLTEAKPSTIPPDLVQYALRHGLSEE